MTTSQQKIEYAYAYSRVSSGKQTIGAGISRQLERAEEICKANNWKLVPQSLVDMGYSAYKGDNLTSGCLKDFIDAAKTKKIKEHSVLIIEDFSRFSRLDISQSERYLIDLLMGGVAVHNGFMGKTYTLSSTNSFADRTEILAGFKAAFEYSDNISRRVNDAFGRKYIHAANNEPVALGYWQPCWIDFVGERKKVGKFKLNDSADVIRQIAIDYINGESMLSISRKLNASKIPCIGRGKKKGKEWNQSLVSYLLSSETLIGNIEIRSKRFVNYLPPVLTQEQWKLLKSRLNANKDKRGGLRDGEWIANLFPNKCKCAKCGTTLASSKTAKRNGEIYRYYKCKTHRVNREKCNVRKMLPIDMVEDYFFLYFIQQQPNTLTTKNNQEHEAVIANLELEISKVTDSIVKAVETLEQITSEELIKKLSKLEAVKKNLVDQKNEATRKMIDATTMPESINSIREGLKILNIKAGIDGKDYLDTNVFMKAVKELHTMLRNPDIRQKLLLEIPKVVERVTIDLEQKLITFTAKDGTSNTYGEVVELPMEIAK